MPTNKNEVPENPIPILQSRYQDGDHQIEITPIGYQVLDTGAIYTSARSLLQNLTGHPKARNWTLGRYFRLDRPDGPAPLPGATILDIFGHKPRPVGSTGLTVDRQGVIRLHQSYGLTIATRHLGIDLTNRSREVQKLLFHGFGSRIFAAGYDPNEVLQEVFKGILARNHGICAWDERKSSFGHYVHMVCGCVLANYHRREQRRRSIEQVGLTVSPVPEKRSQAVGDALSDQPPNPLWGAPKQDIPLWVERDLVAHLRTSVGRRKRAEAALAIKLIPLARQGLTRTEMAAALGESKAHVSKGLAYLKAKTREWAEP